MKRFAIMGALSCALLLGGCGLFNGALGEVSGNSTTAQTAGAVAGATDAQVQAAMNVAAKGLTAGHLAHEAAADAATLAVQTGLLKGTNATAVKGWLDASETALLAADTAYKLGDTTGVANQIATATDLIAKVNAMLKPSAAVIPMNGENLAYLQTMGDNIVEADMAVAWLQDHGIGN